MINMNGPRIAHANDFLAALAELRPTIYFQFDGLDRETNDRIRGADLLKTKLKALDRLAESTSMLRLWPRTSAA
jgi:7,8-dihydro-6-hydroxymethylpterin dimethyltransferase